MERGLFIAASGMLAAQIRQDVIANNLANATNPGFKGEVLSQIAFGDLLLSNTVLLHRALRRAGIEADLNVWEAMPHGGFFGAPEDEESTADQVRFLDRHLEV